MWVTFHYFYVTLIFSCKMVKLILTVLFFPFLLFGFQLSVSVRECLLLGTMYDLAMLKNKPPKFACPTHVLINFPFSLVEGRCQHESFTVIDSLLLLCGIPASPSC